MILNVKYNLGMYYYYYYYYHYVIMSFGINTKLVLAPHLL